MTIREILREELNIINDIWYHGSEEYFNSFKIFNRNHMGNTSVDVPIFLTKDISFAKAYAGHNTPYLYEVKLLNVNIFDYRELQSDETSDKFSEYFYDEISNIFNVDGEHQYSIYRQFIYGSFGVLESNEFIHWLEKNNYDGAYINETNSLNVFILNPSKIEIIDIKKLF